MAVIRKRLPLECRGHQLMPRDTPWVMGILNVTPDSFSDGGRFYDPDAAIQRAHQMVADGADIIDVGAESTRPGANTIGADIELARLTPVLEGLKDIGVPVSVDTYRAQVAAVALEMGCAIINDVTAARDPEMSAVVRDADATFIVMHMQGEPGTMQEAPHYDDVVTDVCAFLAERTAVLAGEGVKEIIVDPGIGFGKRFRDNLNLLHSLDSLGSLAHPLLIGASRKRFIVELAGGAAPDRLSGSLAVAAHCAYSGVDIVRVHDVKETVGMYRVLGAIDAPQDYSADW